jgi:hypothetical protein
MPNDSTQLPEIVVKPDPYGPYDPWDAAGATDKAPEPAAKPPRQPPAPSPAPPPAPSPGPPGQADQPAPPAFDIWAAAGYTPQPTVPPVPLSEAVTRGALQSGTFGLAPAIQGATAAATAPGMTPAQQAAMPVPGVASEAPGMEEIGLGLSRLTGGDPRAREAYEGARDAAAAKQQEAREQHPWGFLGGGLAGGFATPAFGAGVPGTIFQRLLTGGIAGGVGGGLQGAGEAISAGATPVEILKAAGKGAAFGAPTGAVLKGVLGPRLRTTAPTTGERAAQTAEGLGAPLSRGVASDRPFVQATTAKLMSLPFIGERIRGGVKATEEAAGASIAATAEELSQGAPSRAVADVLVRPGIKKVIEANKDSIDAAYGGLRLMIDRDAIFNMPRTARMLDIVRRKRMIAGEDPDTGLERIVRVVQGTTFEGAQRARRKTREAGDMMSPHPGYDADDFNKITLAMTADMKEMVQAAARQKRTNPQEALKAFEEADQQFHALADVNSDLAQLARSPKEGAIATLLSAVREKRGDVPLLAHLRRAMKPDQFDTISGLMLHELGQTAGGFSLAKFATEWDTKVSDHAKRIMFSPEHRAALDEISNLGTHVKGALKQANVSHTASAMILFDVAQAAGVLGYKAASGDLGPAMISELAGHAVGATLGLWLGNSAKARSIANWMRAYDNAATLPTAARIASFKMQTRNMAHTLGLDPDMLMARIESTIAGGPQRGDTDQRTKADQQ